MVKLKIKNTGPIKQGFDSDDGFITINKVSIFIGSQGSGKSTIAKIFSTLSWIEKALVRGDFSTEYLTRYNRFKKQLAYQNIENYLSHKSEIEYIGEAYTIKFKNNKLEIKKTQETNYHFPKIMYIPAERNFVSSIERPDLIKRLPLPLYTFLDEYEAAKRSFNGNIELPINNIKFEYRKQNKKSWLIGSDYKIELLEASSGFQSFVPLFLVTKYLSQIIDKKDSKTYREISVEEERKIRQEIDKIFENENISGDIRRVLLERLSARFKYSCFINIVEEPEQNLYPSSQKEVLFDLLESKNRKKENKLLITTHSPYIINYLTLAIKGNEVKTKIKNNSELLNRLNSIIPLTSTISSDDVSVFQLGKNGRIRELGNYKGLPSDDNYLNLFLEESNDLFINLLEIEDLCQ